MNFEQYNLIRNELRRSNPDLQDGGEANLYSFLKQHHSELLPDIQPSLHKDAEYRCHITDVYLNFLGLSPIWKPKVLITHGVRHSLAIIFKIWAAEKRTALIPSDVYPVYQKIAEESGVSMRLFSQKEWMDGTLSLDVSQDKIGVLLCSPIKPWCLGTVPSQAWMKVLGNKDAELLLDSAYDIEESKASHLLTQIKQGAKIACLSSLSKGWLIPNHAGFVIGSSSLIEKWRPIFVKEPIDKSKLRIAYQALTTDAKRYTVVKGLILDYQQKGLAWLKDNKIPVSGAHQYFAVIPWPWTKLQEYNLLAIPPSVFGSHSEDESVLSFLNPTSFKGLPKK